MKLFLIIILITSSISCSNSKNKQFTIQDYNFESWMGYHKNDFKKNHLFSLLSQGFYKTTYTSNLDSLIDGWIEQHNTALISPIYTFITPKNDEKFSFCLVTDKKDTLNILMIKNGLVPASAMRIPNFNDKKTKIEFKITSNEENQLLKALKNAELHAKHNKLGIWSDDYQKQSRIETWKTKINILKNEKYE